ncbi:MAG: type III secretion system outer membrane ring subunit SctC [Kiritimatiellae bacterium]|nr:type III secretion system outer membrane ring subunit SctC [Kiritimatiellia bacterium]
MKRFATVILAAVALAGAGAAEIPWKLPSYTLVARDMDLRVAFDTFAVAEGLSVVMSESVHGSFSGDFKDVSPNEFLDKMAITHNLIWYYDGAALYVYGAGEISTILVDLKYMKAGEVRKMLGELGVEDARFPIKTTSNDELMMVSGPPRYVALVAETVARADRLKEMRTFNEVEVRLFPLVNTWADDVSFNVSSPESTVFIRGIANLLDDMMDTGSVRMRENVGTNYVADAKSALDDIASSSVRPMIRPENRLNAVLVRDVKSRLPMYEELIKQLDVPQKLVEIGVTVVELSKNDSLDWQLSLKAEGTKKKTTGSIGQNAGNLVEPSAIGGQGLAGALTYLGNDMTVSASLSALKAKGKARSISRTSLITMNNLAAQMTDTQSYHAKVVGTEVATLQEVSAGTRLQIKPRIVMSPSTNVANQVWLTLELDDGGFETISVDSMPMTRSSTLQTQTAIFEDESIMLAGYLRDIEEEAGWGIPYLRDIPILGWLFGGSSTKKETVQRMFILTPHIVDLDTEMLMRLQATRLRDVVDAEKVQDYADDYDLERRQRDLERNETRDRRRDQAKIKYDRRKAEIEHAGEMRKIEHERIDDILTEDKHEWRQEEDSARESLKAERKARRAAKAEKEEQDKKSEEAAE